MRIFGKNRPDIKVVIAGGFFKKLTGLLGRRSIERNYAMFFPDTGSVHTFFMKCPIDIIIADEKLKVVKVSENTRPFSAVFAAKGRHTLEMAAGSVRKMKILEGETLKINGIQKNPQ